MKSLNIIIYKLSHNLENSGMHSVRKMINKKIFCHVLYKGCVTLKITVIDYIHKRNS